MWTWLYEKLRRCLIREENLFEQVAQQVEFVEIDIVNLGLDLFQPSKTPSMDSSIPRQTRLKLAAVSREFDKMDISK